MDMISRIDALHQRVQEPDPFAFVEQYVVHCSCNYENVQYLWRPGDPEPEWRCPTRLALDGVE